MKQRMTEDFPRPFDWRNNLRIHRGKCPDQRRNRVKHSNQRQENWRRPLPGCWVRYSKNKKEKDESVTVAIHHRTQRNSPFENKILSSFEFFD